MVFLGFSCDVGMHFGYPWISIPGSAHYGGGQVQGLDKIDLETNKGNFNMYWTRTLVKPSLVAYIKPDGDAPREISHRHTILERHSIQDILYIDNSAYAGDSGASCPVGNPKRKV
jgi:hypothetical protein